MISRLKFEISSLVNQILDQLPADIWSRSDTTFLDPAMGGGQFVREIERRLKEAGHSDDNIHSRVFGYEEYEHRVRYAVNKYELKGTYARANFLEMEHQMKFDAIVGNPPYLKGTWQKFLEKAVSSSKAYVSMIAPDATASFSSRSDSFNEFLVNHGIQSKVDCTNHFPNISAGGIVTYYFNVNLPANPFALVDTSISGTILRKIINTPGEKLDAKLSRKRATHEINAPRSSEQTSHTQIQNIESITKTGPVIAWIDMALTDVLDGGSYWLTNRYFGKDADTPVIEYQGKIGISTNILVVKKIPGWTVDDFKKVYLSNLFRFCLSYMRNGMFDTSPRFLRQFPVVQRGQELYAHFKLTPEEIEYVESFTQKA